MKVKTADRLKEIMRERNLKQVDILTLLKPYLEQYNVKLGRNDLSQYVSGKVEPGQKKIYVLAKALNVSEPWLMGYDYDKTLHSKNKTISEGIVTFPVIGDLSAGYEHIAIEEWDGDTIAIPDIYVKGDKNDYIVLRIIGNSMYPFYLDGDYVLIRKQDTVESGQIAAIIYDNDYATIKRVEFGKNSIMLIPFNPEYQPRTIQGEELNHCRIIGIPKLLIREIQ